MGVDRKRIGQCIARCRIRGLRGGRKFRHCLVYASSTKYVAERACEVYEHEYAIHYPKQERPAGRPLKTGPLYDRLLSKGAVFGARFG